MAVVIQGIRNKLFSYLWGYHPKSKEERTLKATYVLLQMSDLILTVIAASSGFSELNIVMRSLLNNTLLLITIKLVIPLFVAWFIPGRLLIPAIALLSLVVCWDIKELLFLLF